MNEEYIRKKDWSQVRDEVCWRCLCL